MARTLLIVDDHPGFRTSARRMLEADGYQVVGEAPDGRSGIAAARAPRPDIVLLDVHLPDIDGFEVAEQPREPPRPRAGRGAGDRVIGGAERPRGDRW